eukprot:TRINITY_DN6407_c0_g1_i1.p1 TRINITY_DN6407_c0_g1~~TRINITY_DN6407_c0_g1_i1.p1  ORF type:complete len:292 (-),score=29.99 TRINITY_DN6407_c0_g1_i1:590-1465(-)
MLLLSSSQKIALSSRHVLRLSGRDSLNLLQGLVTPNVFLRPSCYGYALDVRGRILFDFFLHTLSGANDEYALDLDSQETASIAHKHLTQYRLRKKVKLALDPDLTIIASTSQGNPSAIASFRDPRTVDTDLRLYRELHSGITESCLQGEEEEYNECRLRLGWAEGRDEIPPGACFPLEYNGDILPGGSIAFDKGCYIGQELTARTHHTGVIRKRIMPLEFKEGSGHKDMDGATITDSKGRRVGKLRSKISPSGNALGLIRIKEALTEGNGILECNGLECRVHTPPWWPLGA